MVVVPVRVGSTEVKACKVGRERRDKEHSKRKPKYDRDLDLNERGDISPESIILFFRLGQVLLPGDGKTFKSSQLNLTSLSQ